ncbi:hypothetical protein [Algibacter mikhailovii]|uniref:Uncharacterized protein n=1 Tax=Algibacter mikhailovii TaxID=425498 RepID=A0A918RD97_9FLAO|nr:hypothetical protein [Algibacter mikhailovii]GGZ94537.1 hypothetical protein GCM10007028_36030 [Algibacter mikhailovii]
MSKSYNITLNGTLIGTSELEKADAPMGVAFGLIEFKEIISPYEFFKEYCSNKQIELASDYPEDKMISTMSIPELKITNEDGIEIKGVGNQITGMDNEEYEISIFGIPYPFYEEEFPHHVKEYENIFNKE